MGMTTLSVEESTRERFNDIKQQLDEEQPEVPDHTADSFLNALLDSWENARADGPKLVLGGSSLSEDEVEALREAFMDGTIPDLEDLLDELESPDPEEIGRIQSAVETIEERTGAIQRQLEGMQR